MEIEVRKRSRVPHWHVEGGSYFLTLALHDAISATERTAAMNDHDAVIADIRRRRGLITVAERTAVDRELRRRLEKLLDASNGCCWLRDQRLARTVADAITFFDEQRYCLWSWSVMPNHLHAAFWLLPGHDISSVVASWKKYTARNCNKLLERTGTFWQGDFWDRTIRSKQHLDRVVRYIMANPAKAGLTNWPFARVYVDRLN